VYCCGGFPARSLPCGDTCAKLLAQKFPEFNVTPKTLKPLLTEGFRQDTYAFFCRKKAQLFVNLKEIILMVNKKMSGYKLTRDWYNWVSDNPEKGNVNNGALYLYIVELCNKLGWPDKFQLPTGQSKIMTKIARGNSYSKALKELADWGFIKIVQESKNIHTACVISLMTDQNTKRYGNDMEAIRKRYGGDKETLKKRQRNDTKYKPLINLNKPVINYKTSSKQILKKSATLRVFISPILEEVETYFEENGYLKSAGAKAFKFYNDADWIDSRGNKVRNWKQKMQGVWFKSENLAAPDEPKRMVM